MVFIYSMLDSERLREKSQKKNFNHKPVAGIQVVDLLLNIVGIHTLKKNTCHFKYVPFSLLPPPHKNIL